jgi:hypothetical protein
MNEITDKITKIIEASKTNDYKTIGNGIGEIASIIFLDGVNENKDDTSDFLVGFLLGIDESGEINVLMKCVKDMEQIIHKIKEALILLKDSKKIEKYVQGLVLQFEAVSDLLKMLKPCSARYPVLKKLLEIFYSTEIQKHLYKILQNQKPYTENINEMIEGFNLRNMTQVGVNLGNFISRLFLLNDKEESSEESNEENEEQGEKDEEKPKPKSGLHFFEHMGKQLNEVPSFFQRIGEHFGMRRPKEQDKKKTGKKPIKKRNNNN